jgi:hypothetical protein
MKITEMTHEHFNREMLKLLTTVQTGANCLKAIDPQFQLKPVRIPYATGLSEPFPLALELRKCWDYARGAGPKPEGMERILQDLEKLLWCPLGATSYEIPASWWETPLGAMTRMCEVRDAIDRELSVPAEHLALLVGCTPQWIRHLCTAGEIKAEKEKRPGSSQTQWAIPAKEAKKFLEKREEKING